MKNGKHWLLLVVAALLVVVTGGGTASGAVAHSPVLPTRMVVCVEQSSSRLFQAVANRCVTASQFKVEWRVRGTAPQICVNTLSRKMRLSSSRRCLAKHEFIARATAKRPFLGCADKDTGVLRWPRTGVCWWQNTPVVMVSMPRTTTSTTTTTVPTTTTTTVAPATCADGGACVVGDTTSTTTTTVPTTTTTTTVAPGTCADGGACVVGDTGPGGGIVFYVSVNPFTSTGSDCGTTCKYLEAATSDQSTGTITWCSNTTSWLSASARAIGTGMANTTTADTTCTSGAIQIAADFANNGKIDWHLPSRDELTQLYSRKTTVGGFSLFNYWSSTETNPNAVWVARFDNFTTGVQFKHRTYSVRPVRAFG